MKANELRQVKYYNTFREMVEDIAIGREDFPAIQWYTRKGEKKGVSYGTFRQDVRDLQASFVHRNYVGKNIAILGENSYEWLLVYFAATYCGAVAVCVDIEQSEETLAQMIKMTDVEVLFCSASMEKICRTQLSSEREMFLLNGPSNEVLSVEDLKREGAQLLQEGAVPFSKEPGPDDTSSILFTSGTTNYAKPVMFSQKALLTNASDALACVAIGKVVFTSLPFYHTYGLTCSVIGELIGGVEIHINGNLKTMMRDLSLARPHSILTVPLVLETLHARLWKNATEKKQSEQLRLLLNYGKIRYHLGCRRFGKRLDKIREQCLGSVRLVICGAAHIDPKIVEDFAYMGITVLQGYGITECSPLVSVNRIGANKFDSVGLVMPNCQIKIDQDEILVKGSNVMQGYYNLPELTEESFRDGWFATGDLGYVDKDGFLFITGRKKNLIVFQNGKKISPEMFEEKIRKIPLVQDVLVYGATSGASSDDVQMAVSIFPNKKKTEGLSSYEILDLLQKEIDEINRNMPLYQQIQMINIREQGFEKTTLQKIKRHMV